MLGELFATIHGMKMMQQYFAGSWDILSMVSGLWCEYWRWGLDVFKTTPISYDYTHPPSKNHTLLKTSGFIAAGCMAF